jgi:hypothetical protein
MADYVELDLLENEGVDLDLIDSEVVLDVQDVDITIEVIGEVGPRGPQGIQGEIGPPGPPSFSFYRHHQTSASDRWLIEHDLFYPPAVTIVDSAGTVLIADVVYIDDFHIQVDFSAPTAGYAYCT